jgi:hypothetical protein
MRLEISAPLPENIGIFHSTSLNIVPISPNASHVGWAGRRAGTLVVTHADGHARRVLVPGKFTYDPAVGLGRTAVS